MTGAEFRELLRQSGLRQIDAAWICGVYVRQVRAWCLGEFAVPQYAQLLIKAYAEERLPPDWLCSNIEKDPPN
jgi:DNA-binding transcriptional regulator YiaG